MLASFCQAYPEIELEIAALEAAFEGDPERLRSALNAQRADGAPKLTILPFLVRALVTAIDEHPQFNSTFDSERGVLTTSPAQ